MSLAVVVLPRPSTLAPPAEGVLPAEAARRIDGGELGDSAALAGYRRRALQVAFAAALAAVLLGVGAAALHPSLFVFSGLAAFGAWFDRQRGALGAALRIEGDSLLLRFSETTVRVPASAIEAIGFGAPAASGGPAPETFWRGDFGPVARSHLVVVRLAGAKLPRRVIVPEASPLHAQAAAAKLHRLAASLRPR
ncbi:MAG: hypothetical protein GQE15_15100 [Archangiaceae bacterium]|nr:hypothetical protein [Archangiaceae bacterium]